MGSENSKGLVLVVSGPAGSGKGTIDGALVDSGDFAFSVSATTRAPRPGEIDGRHYHFIDRAAFERMIAAGEMLEYNEYCGNYYGTPMSEIKKATDAGRHLILEIDVNGARRVKAAMPDAVVILLCPPSFAEQEKRLRHRATETEEKILARLAQTHEELADMSIYDYVVVNRENGQAAAEEDVRAIVRAECLRRSRRPEAAAEYFGEGIR